MKRSIVFHAAAALISLGAAVLSTSAAAGTAVGVHIGVPAPVYVEPAPVYVQPAPQVVYQSAPVHRHGRAWIPGHYEWQGHRHVWVPGYYVAPQAAYRPRRDYDGDGVPNRWDRAPANPYRY
jgi:hypothetical protein